MIQPIDGGIWIVLGVSMALAAFVAVGATLGAAGILRGAGAWLVSFVAMTPVMLAMLCFLGGLALLAWQSYQYLRSGNWPEWTLVQVVQFLGVQVRHPGDGLGGPRSDRAIGSEWSAVLGLLVIVPVGVLLMVGLTVGILRLLMKPSRRGKRRSTID